MEPDELIPELPVTITEIRIQKKNQNRFSLFHNDRFLLGVSSKTLTDFSLEKGVSLTTSLFQKLLSSENTFAAKFITDKATLNRWGPKKIETELIKKGISKKIIQETLKNTFDNLSQSHICVDLIHKRKIHFLREEDPYRRKRKIFQYLAGRGFYGPDIQKAITQSGITEDD